MVPTWLPCCHAKQRWHHQAFLQRIYSLKRRLKKYCTSGLLPVLLKLERRGAWKVLMKEDHVTSYHFAWSDCHQNSAAFCVLRNSGTVIANKNVDLKIRVSMDFQLVKMAQKGDCHTVSHYNNESFVHSSNGPPRTLRSHRSPVTIPASASPRSRFWPFQKQMLIFNW